MFPGRSSDLQAEPTRRTSQALGPVSISAFVPAYRCGAVPDFHRIPFSSSFQRNRGIEPLYLGSNRNATPPLVNILRKRRFVHKADWVHEYLIFRLRHIVGAAMRERLR